MKNTPAAVLVATFAMFAACKTVAPSTDSGSSDVTAKGGTTSNTDGAGAGSGGASNSDAGGAGSSSSISGGGGNSDGGTDDCPGAGVSYDATLADSGKALVLSYGCAGCHQATPASAGLTLEGKTTSVQAGQSIFPKNLTPDRATGLGCWTEDQVVNAILNGIDDQSERLCVMPAFAGRGMDGASAHAIANFLRSLPPANHEIPESVCPGTGNDADGG